MSSESKQLHTSTVEVRWADLDLLGHVNNTKYFEYTMEARVRFYYDRVDSGAESGGAMVLRKADMEYFVPLVLESGPLEIETSVLHVGTKSYTLRHAIRDVHGVLCAVGTVVMVGWSMSDQRSRPLTDGERAALSASLVEDVVG